METKPDVMEISFNAMQEYITELQNHRTNARFNSVLSFIIGLCLGVGAANLFHLL